MAEPLTIYECPVCGTWSEDADYTGGHDFARFPDCHRNQRVPARVFREEDVRPLWEELGVVAAGHPHWITTRAVVDAFPAPEDWTDEPEEDREPSDDEIYNRPGMEGGIPYPTSPDTRDEHDPTL